MGKDSAGTRQPGCERLPLTGHRVAFEQFACRPIAASGLGEQRLVDVQLTAASDDVPGALGHHRGGLVVIGLVQESAAWVDIAPQVHRAAGADFSLARYQGFRVHPLGYVEAPGERIERAQQIGHEGPASSGAGIPRRRRKLAEEVAAGVTDDVGILEFCQVVLVAVVGRAVSTRLCLGVGRAHRLHFHPGIGSGGRVAGDHGVGHVVPDFHRGSDRAAAVAAVQPIANTDHTVCQAVGGEYRRHQGRRVEGERRQARREQDGGDAGAQTVRALHGRTVRCELISATALATSGSP
ncbi:hypothetical protein D9M70_469070 [compost metagenome]